MNGEEFAKFWWLLMKISLRINDMLNTLCLNKFFWTLLNLIRILLDIHFEYLNFNGFFFKFFNFNGFFKLLVRTKKSFGTQFVIYSSTSSIINQIKTNFHCQFLKIDILHLESKNLILSLKNPFFKPKLIWISLILPA